MAGGRSSRLGMEKAFINYHGKPQIKHLYVLLRSLHLPPYISCNPQQVDRFREFGPLIVDKHPSTGPMGGVFSAMSACPDKDWLVIACDMPMITSFTLQNLLNNDTGQPVITYKGGDKAFPEVLLTIYKKELLPVFQEAMDNGSYSLQTLLKGVDVAFVLPENDLELTNVNTRVDLERIKRLLQNK